MPGFYQVNTSLHDLKDLLKKEELEEEPVPLDVFVADKFYLGLPPLSPIQTKIVEYMTQIYHQDTLIRLYGVESGTEKWKDTVNEVVAMMGKGSGKDYSIRIAFARIIYLLHCLKDPLSYYGMGGGEYIDLLNIALNSEQAQRVFFEPLKNILTASPYFQSVEFNPMSKQITFLSKPIRAFSGHSEAEGWEGFNLIAVVLDEIAAFKVQSDAKLLGEGSKSSAKAIYDMARLSTVSRFPDVGKVALLSFPRYKDDFIDTRYGQIIKEKKTSIIKRDLGPVEISWEEDDIISYKEPKVWAVKCPTFVANPTKKAEDFVSDFIRDPIGSKSRILCVPPLVSEAYFRDKEAVLRCFHQHDESCHETNCSRPPFDEDGRLPASFKDLTGPERFIHIDLGLNRDRSAVAMVHCRGVNRSELDGQLRPVVKMDLIKYWQAPPEGEIDFNDIRRFVFSLSSRFRIGMISIDNWNSQDTKRIFEMRGLYTEYMIIKKEHYDTLSTSIYDGRLEAYYHPILLEQELLKLQLVKGTKVDHPPSGNAYKDGSDCLAGSVYTCTKNTVFDEEIEVEVLGFVPAKEKKKQKEVSAPDKPAMPDELADYLANMKLF